MGLLRIEQCRWTRKEPTELASLASRVRRNCGRNKRKAGTARLHDTQKQRIRRSCAVSGNPTFFVRSSGEAPARPRRSAHRRLGRGFASGNSGECREETRWSCGGEVAVETTAPIAPTRRRLQASPRPWFSSATPTSSSRHCVARRPVAFARNPSELPARRTAPAQERPARASPRVGVGARVRARDPARVSVLFAEQPRRCFAFLREQEVPPRETRRSSLPRAPADELRQRTSVLASAPDRWRGGRAPRSRHVHRPTRVEHVANRAAGAEGPDAGDRATRCPRLRDGSSPEDAADTARPQAHETLEVLHVDRQRRALDVRFRACGEARHERPSDHSRITFTIPLRDHSKPRIVARAYNHGKPDPRRAPCERGRNRVRVDPAP